MCHDIVFGLIYHDPAGLNPAILIFNNESNANEARQNRTQRDYFGHV